MGGETSLAELRVLAATADAGTLLWFAVTVKISRLLGSHRSKFDFRNPLH